MTGFRATLTRIEMLSNQIVGKAQLRNILLQMIRVFPEVSRQAEDTKYQEACVLRDQKLKNTYGLSHEYEGYTAENMRDTVYPDYEWDNAFIPGQVNLFPKSGRYELCYSCRMALMVVPVHVLWAC